MDVYVMEVSPLLKEEALCSCLPFLSKSRREKLSRLLQPQDQARSAGAALLLRHALKQTGISLENAAVASGAHGKPYLPDYPALQFSLSHSGNWAACAVDTDAVGVDVEEIRPARLAAAKRSFAREDYMCLQGLSQRERDVLFAAIWTAKESVLKWAGDGLSGGLQNVAVKRERLRPCAARYRQSNLSLTSLLPRPGVMLTAASEKDTRNLQLSVVSFENIL